MIRPTTRGGLAASLAAFAVVAVAAGCGSAGSTPTNAITATSTASAAATSSGGVVSVRIPDPGNSGVLAVGKKDGSLDAALAKVGAKVVWTGTAGPFAPAAEEMAANELDFAQGSITSAVTSLAATPVFELFAQQPPDKIGEGILVNSSSAIKSVQDLVGKTVAVNKGGTGEYLLRKALTAANIPVSKVNLVYLSPAQKHALRTRPWGQLPVTSDFVAEQQHAADQFYANGLIERPVKVADAVLPSVNELVAASRG